jgi:hypothetical protein
LGMHLLPRSWRCCSTPLRTSKYGAPGPFCSCNAPDATSFSSLPGGLFFLRLTLYFFSFTCTTLCTPVFPFTVSINPCCSFLLVYAATTSVRSNCIKCWIRMA